MIPKEQGLDDMLGRLQAIVESFMKRTVSFIINGASKAVHAVININNSMRFPLEAFKILIESL